MQQSKSSHLENSCGNTVSVCKMLKKQRFMTYDKKATKEIKV